MALRKNWIRKATREIDKMVSYTRATARGTAIAYILWDNDPSHAYEKLLDLIAVRAVTMTPSGPAAECHGSLKNIDRYPIKDLEEVNLIHDMFRRYGQIGVIAYVSWKTEEPLIERSRFWQAMEYLEKLNE